MKSLAFSNLFRIGALINQTHPFSVVTAGTAFLIADRSAKLELLTHIQKIDVQLFSLEVTTITIAALTLFTIIVTTRKEGLVYYLSGRISFITQSEHATVLHVHKHLFYINFEKGESCLPLQVSVLTLSFLSLMLLNQA